MLDIRTQGDLASAIQQLGDAIKDNPDAFLNLRERHGDGLGRMAAAATLVAAGATDELIDQALTPARSPIDRFVGGTAPSLVDIAAAIRGIPDIRLDDLRRVAEANSADPSSLPEAMVEPFREGIAVGDYAGALGYGLPEVLARVAALGRVRRRADGLTAPEELTLDRLKSDPDVEGVTNAGPYSAEFEKWINRGGTVELMPEGHFRHTADSTFWGGPSEHLSNIRTDTPISLRS